MSVDFQALAALEKNHIFLLLPCLNFTLEHVFKNSMAIS